MNKALILAFLSVFLFNPVHAKRYVITPDHEVDIEFNIASQDEINGEDFTVLNWNMYKAGKPSWKQDYESITKGKDILLLQEFFLDEKMISTFEADTGRGYFLASSFNDTKMDNIPSGVGVASFAQPLSTFWQRSYYKEPFIRTAKMTMFAEYAISNSDKTLLVASIHAVNFVSSRKLKHMINEAAFVIANHDGPVVFGGDFNTWSKKKIRTMREIMKKAGMKEVSFRNDGRMKTFGNILDYYFIKGLNVKESKVYGDIEGSDHKAMELRLSVQ